MENRKELREFCTDMQCNKFFKDTDVLNFIIPEMTKVDIAPMSVNKAWQGKRFKTPEYKAYEKHLLLILPKLTVPHGEMKIIFEFGMSNICSDIDNIIKPLLDVLQKKYWFNDRYVMEMDVKKVKVAKGSEYVKFAFIPINNLKG